MQKLSNTFGSRKSPTLSHRPQPQQPRMTTTTMMMTMRVGIFDHCCASAALLEQT